MIEIYESVMPSAMEWKMAIQGMRNSYNSWENSDSRFCTLNDCHRCDLFDVCMKDDLDYTIGERDLELMKKLSESSSSHSKFRRMLPVFIRVDAPLYWWKEMDTYTVGKVQNSCSTMHKITEKEFGINDFSHEHLFDYADIKCGEDSPLSVLTSLIGVLNQQRRNYLNENNEKKRRYGGSLYNCFPLLIIKLGL